MDELSRDERMRRLQRVAYGAVVSDAERAAALAELDALRRERTVAEAEAEASDAERAASSEASDPPLVVERAPTGSTRAVSEWIAASDAASVRRFRWVVAAGTVALLLGIGIGWQVGTRVSASEPAALRALAGTVDLAASEIPVADTSVRRLFDTAPTATDAPALPALDDLIAPTDYRLLVTRPDGVALHIARKAGDVCVVVVHPDWGTAASCTADGRFPEAGLWVEGRGRGSVIRGTIHADGAAELTPAGYLHDGPPSTG